MSKRPLYGLIGFPLGHSFSPGYFTDKFAAENIDAEYRAFPISDVHDFKTLLAQHPDLAGLNVTIPYKEQIIPLLDECDDAAIATGAVNCIRIKNWITTGYNTDIIGFEQSLVPLLNPAINMALVLGSGGSSKAIRFVLNKLGIPYLVVSRQQEADHITYADVTEQLLHAHLLIINTTPLGMFPDIEQSPPIPYKFLTNKHLLFDLIYNPAETRFLEQGRLHGAQTKNGMEMLQLQAEASLAIWNL